MAPPPPAGPKKIQRPVLSPHVAHAHAFAAVPSPGAPKSATSSYFPLPTPPAPLRTFALAKSGESSADGDASTSYPTSIGDVARQARINLNSGEKSRGATDGPSSSSATRPDGPPKSPFTRTPPIGSQYQFASASFPASTPNRSSGFSSSSSASASARSALSIAEIDCFFVQGSRSSAYSAARSNSSSQSRSRPPSEPGGGSASLSELGMSSNEEASSGDNMWMSDEAERERQREERKMFMKARQSLREEARKKKRVSAGGPTDNTHAATWREVIQAQAVIPLKGIPESRTGSSRGASASGSPRGIQHANQPTGPLADMLTAPPLPSGPGPPPESEIPVDTMADIMSKSMIVSDGTPEAQKSDQDSTPPADGTPPALNRFDSGDTAVGIPAIIPSIDTHPS